jgi:hypothetical protein
MTAPLLTAAVADPTAQAGPGTLTLAGVGTDARARLRTAPPLEPPYDDDAPPPVEIRTPRLRIVAGLARPDELPFGPARSGLRAVLRRSVIDEDEDPMFGHQATPRSALSDPGTYGSRFLRSVLEVLARRRPLQQLLPCTTEDVYEELTAQLYRTSLADWSTAAVRTMRVSEPADGIAEITGVVAQTSRVRAVALRLEGIDRRWRCTHLTML